MDVVRDPSGRYHSLVMEYVDNVDWKQLFPRLTEADTKHYTFQLLKVRLTRVSNRFIDQGLCPYRR